MRRARRHRQRGDVRWTNQNQPRSCRRPSWSRRASWGRLPADPARSRAQRVRLRRVDVEHRPHPFDTRVPGWRLAGADDRSGQPRDLERHRADFEARQGFTYTVLEPRRHGDRVRLHLSVDRAGHGCRRPVMGAGRPRASRSAAVRSGVDVAGGCVALPRQSNTPPARWNSVHRQNDRGGGPNVDACACASTTNRSPQRFPTSPPHTAPWLATGAASSTSSARCRTRSGTPPTRCAEWDVKGVVSHLVTVDQYWVFALGAARREGAPTMFLEHFDPSTATDAQVAALRDVPNAELLDQFEAGTQSLVEMVRDVRSPRVGRDRRVAARAPPGAAALRAHVLGLVAARTRHLRAARRRRSRGARRVARGHVLLSVVRRARRRPRRRRAGNRRSLVGSRRRPAPLRRAARAPRCGSNTTRAYAST